METQPKNQKAGNLPDQGSTSNHQAEPDTEIRVPDRHYHHNDPETPDSAHIEEIDPDTGEKWLKNIDVDNGNQNYQNQDSISKGLKSQDDDI